MFKGAISLIAVVVVVYGIFWTGWMTKEWLINRSKDKSNNNS